MPTSSQEAQDPSQEPAHPSSASPTTATIAPTQPAIQPAHNRSGSSLGSQHHARYEHTPVSSFSPSSGRPHPTHAHPVVLQQVPQAPHPEAASDIALLDRLDIRPPVAHNQIATAPSTMSYPIDPHTAASNHPPPSAPSPAQDGRNTGMRSMHDLALATASSTPAPTSLSYSQPQYASVSPNTGPSPGVHNDGASSPMPVPIEHPQQHTATSQHPRPSAPPSPDSQDSRSLGMRSLHNLALTTNLIPPPAPTSPIQHPSQPDYSSGAPRAGPFRRESGNSYPTTATALHAPTQPHYSSGSSGAGPSRPPGHTSIEELAEERDGTALPAPVTDPYTHGAPPNQYQTSLPSPVYTGIGAHNNAYNHTGQRRPSPRRTVSYSENQPLRAGERFPNPILTSPLSASPQARNATFPTAPSALPPGTQFEAQIPYENGDMGVQGMPGSMHIPQGGPSRRASNANHARTVSMAPTVVNSLPPGERTIEDRLQPTLKAARAQMESAQRLAKVYGWAVNCAIGAQVVLGALTTGVAAAASGHQASIATSVLGGMSTLAASYLARQRGTNEPEASLKRAVELDSYIRELDAFILDNGYLLASAGPENLERMVQRYRRRFEEILGNDAEGVLGALEAQEEKDQLHHDATMRIKDAAARPPVAPEKMV